MSAARPTTVGPDSLLWVKIFAIEAATPAKAGSFSAPVMKLWVCGGWPGAVGASSNKWITMPEGGGCTIRAARPGTGANRHAAAKIAAMKKLGHGSLP